MGGEGATGAGHRLRPFQDAAFTSPGTHVRGGAGPLSPRPAAPRQPRAHSRRRHQLRSPPGLPGPPPRPRRPLRGRWTWGEREAPGAVLRAPHLPPQGDPLVRAVQPAPATPAAWPTGARRAGPCSVDATGGGTAPGQPGRAAEAPAGTATHPRAPAARGPPAASPRTPRAARPRRGRARGMRATPAPRAGASPARLPALGPHAGTGHVHGAQARGRERRRRPSETTWKPTSSPEGPRRCASLRV